MSALKARQARRASRTAEGCRICLRGAAVQFRIRWRSHGNKLRLDLRVMRLVMLRQRERRACWAGHRTSPSRLHKRESQVSGNKPRPELCRRQGCAREKSFGFPLSWTCSSSPTVGFQRGHRGSGRYGEQVEFERTCARVVGAERCCPAYGLDHTPSPILARNRVISTAVTRSTIVNSPRLTRGLNSLPSTRSHSRRDSRLSSAV